MNFQILTISLNLLTSAVFATPPTLHTTQSPSQVMSWLKPESIVKTPEPVHTGTLRQHEGSTFATGNLLIDIPLPTLGLSLIYNSVASERQLGFGRGFGLSLERILYLKDNNSGFVAAGDGSHYDLLKNGTSGSWKSKDQTELDSKFTKRSASPYLFEETTPSGTVLTYNTFYPTNDQGPFALSSIRDRFENHIDIARNAQKQIETITYPHNRRISFTILDGLITRIIGTNGEEYQLNYDSRARLARVVYPDGSPWVIEYDQATAHISRLTNSDGFVTKYSYYIGGILNGILSRGRLTKISYTSTSVTIDQTGNKVVEAFSHQNNIAGITYRDTNGIKEHWERNTDRSIKKYRDHLGKQTKYTYVSGNPFPTMIEYPTYQKINYTYNADNRLTSETLADGLGTNIVRTISDYDPANGGVLTRSSTNGKATTYAYDRGALSRVTSPIGQVLFSATYNSEGSMTSNTNKNNETTRYVYAQGDLVSSTDPFGRTTTFTRNGLGSVTRAADDIAVLTQEYNAMGIPLGYSRITLLASGVSIDNDSSIVRASNGAITYATQQIRVDGQTILESRDAYDASSPGRFISSTVQGPIGPSINLLGD